MPTDVLEVTKRFMRDPIRILVKKEELTLEGIKQFYVNVEKEVGLNFSCFQLFNDLQTVILQWCLKNLLQSGLNNGSSYPSQGLRILLPFQNGKKSLYFLQGKTLPPPFLNLKIS